MNPNEVLAKSTPLEELARYRNCPSAPVTPESRLAHFRDAWRDIDAAVDAVSEIEFDERKR